MLVTTPNSFTAPTQLWANYDHREAGESLMHIHHVLPKHHMARSTGDSAFSQSQRGTRGWALVAQPVQFQNAGLVPVKGLPEPVNL